MIIFIIILLSDSLSFCELFSSSFFSEITTVISPFKSFENNSKSSTFFLIYSSYNFEISLQKTIFLPLKFIFISGITLLIFLGEIKKTIVLPRADNF
ncbi:hypothetical protein ACIJYE_07105 [Candidatus Pelagibacter bacterium nBUS_30]|uniref:hypothetical protein n=1 Tax=Candidatus Pelagibacter bacterium nBUS_30 TaxID=3374191 RepID=UPI003EBA8CF4